MSGFWTAYGHKLTMMVGKKHVNVQGWIKHALGQISLMVPLITCMLKHFLQLKGFLVLGSKFYLLPPSQNDDNRRQVDAIYSKGSSAHCPNEKLLLVRI